MPVTSTAYLLLGSNRGDREAHLSYAREKIREGSPFCRFSPVYETEPVGVGEQPWFLNQAVEVITELPPDSLLQWAHRLEKERGRERGGSVKAPRTLDVDLLLCDDRVVGSPTLVLPHPRLLQRRFVLVPMNDLDPTRKVPPSGITVGEALKQVADPSIVRPWDHEA